MLPLYLQKTIRLRYTLILRRHLPRSVSGLSAVSRSSNQAHFLGLISLFLHRSMIPLITMRKVEHIFGLNYRETIAKISIAHLMNTAMESHLLLPTAVQISRVSN